MDPVDDICDLRNKPLGHLKSIIFWNDHQKKVINSLEKENSVIIMGDYGSGKTLILEAATRKLIEKNYQLLFINAFDYKHNDSKAKDDILDISFRQKFGDIFKNMDDIRFDLSDKNKSCIHSIYEFIENRRGKFKDTVVGFYLNTLL